ncbi:cyclin-like protein [Tuber indicum]|nr:cyclin-like protein [Tuber indicum]
MSERQNLESQWIFTEEELLRTPSVLDGISPELEREQRGKGCNFILQMGIQLKLPQLTLATASVFLHRFYMQNSLKKHHYYETAATALFVATKVEENMRKFGELVAACVRAAQKNHALEVHRDDKEFWKWKDCILTKEDYLLESICFDLSVEAPYNLLLQYTNKLGVQTRQLIRTAWTFINDSTLTMLCLLYPSKTIAAAALYCAAKHCGIEFPDQDGKAWWDVIGVSIKDIKRACNYMAMVYDEPPDGTNVGTTFRKNPLRGEDGVRYVATPENGTETTRTRVLAVNNSSPPAESVSRSRTESRSGSEGGKRMRDQSRTDEEISEEAVKKKLKLHEEAVGNGVEVPENNSSMRGKEKAPPPPPPPEKPESGELEEGEVDD